MFKHERIKAEAAEEFAKLTLTELQSRIEQLEGLVQRKGVEFDDVRARVYYHSRLAAAQEEMGRRQS
jgi:hypothetical protein